MCLGMNADLLQPGSDARRQGTETSKGVRDTGGVRIW